MDPGNLGLVCNETMKDVKSHYLHDYDYKIPNVYGRIMMIKENLKKTYNDNPPEDLKWLNKFNPGLVGISPYWVLKRFYRKLKGIK